MGYTVVGSARTRAVRVLWMLEELGQSYAHLPVGPGSDEARRFNPSGKVPVLLVGDVALTDSIAILTWLADHHGQFTYPAGSLERGRQDALTGQIVDEMDAVLWAYARHSFVLPAEMRVEAVKPSLKWEFQRNQARMLGRLQGPYLMGERMTVPDLLLTHCLGWARVAKFPDLEPGWDDYLARMRGRAAYQKVFAAPAS